MVYSNNTWACRQRFRLRTTLLYITLLANGAAMAAPVDNSELRLSVGASLQSRNDVQIPNSDAGTRFSLADEVDETVFAAIRLELNHSFTHQHGFRILLAPLSYTEQITFDDPVNFEGQSFAPNQQTSATYRFNSWRLGYHYTIKESDAARFRIGATLKVRDAEIRLEQGDDVASNDDLGVVPLLYLNARFQLTDRFRVTADLDALGGGPGRAIDAGILFDYKLSQRWHLGLDLRVLDGGADIDELFNFARFDSGSLALSVRF